MNREIEAAVIRLQRSFEELAHTRDRLAEAFERAASATAQHIESLDAMMQGPRNRSAEPITLVAEE
jgi:hypothetical protein